MGLVSLLFGFKGRINRVQYWLGSLGAGFGVILLLVVLLVIGGMPNPAASKEQQAAQALATIGLMVIPALLLASWCGLALQWKRFHDRGRSGAWVFLPMLPSFMMVSSVFGAIATGAHPAAIAQAAQPWATILWIIQLGMLIDLGFLPGKEGPNKYGDPPGGGVSGGAPSPAIPGKAQPAKLQPAPGVSGLGSAESAIERAIAARAKQAQAPTPAPAQFQRPAAGAAQASALRPAATATFGRKVTQ